jgi:hypothetical protein
MNRGEWIPRGHQSAPFGMLSDPPVNQPDPPGVHFNAGANRFEPLSLLTGWAVMANDAFARHSDPETMSID